MKSTFSPVSLVTPSGTLYGTLESPSTDNLIPVFLIISGSGPTDRDGNSAIESKDAGLNEQALRFDDFVDDAVAWVTQLRNDARFSEVGIIGHSEGSLIGMLTTARTIAGTFISLEGAGRPAYEIIHEQFAGQTGSIVAEVTRINVELKAGNTVEDIDPKLYSLFRPGIQPYMISWYKYDPAIEIARLTCPVLIVMGTTDIQVKQTDAELLKAAKPDAVYTLIDGMNHVLKDAPIDPVENMATYSNPDLPLSADLLDALLEFFKYAL